MLALSCFCWSIFTSIPSFLFLQDSPQLLVIIFPFRYLKSFVVLDCPNILQDPFVYPFPFPLVLALLFEVGEVVDLAQNLLAFLLLCPLVFGNIRLGHHVPLDVSFLSIFHLNFNLLNRRYASCIYLLILLL